MEYHKHLSTLLSLTPLFFKKKGMLFIILPHISLDMSLSVAIYNPKKLNSYFFTQVANFGNSTKSLPSLNVHPNDCPTLYNKSFDKPSSNLSLLSYVSDSSLHIPKYGQSAVQSYL